MRHLANVSTKEPCISQNGVIGESLDARPRSERGARLVEGDVPVLADATEEELNAAIRLDFGFIRVAFANKIFSVTVQYVDLRGRDVD